MPFRQRILSYELKSKDDRIVGKNDGYAVARVAPGMNDAVDYARLFAQAPAMATVMLELVQNRSTGILHPEDKAMLREVLINAGMLAPSEAEESQP